MNMKTSLKMLLLAAVAALALSCGGRRARQQQEAVAAAAAEMKVFLPPIAPSGLAPAEQRDYLRCHYWDRFDFSDTLFVHKADTLLMLEAFASYVSLLSEHPTDGAPMDSLMRRASASAPMLRYFSMLAERVLRDPNSPLRNGEFYIPVLRAQLASPYLDQYEKLGPEYDLQIALQNRLGQPANDFRYTLASGATGRLYDIRAEYVLLFINNQEAKVFEPHLSKNLMCTEKNIDIPSAETLKNLFLLPR